jgi:hypothetical protein
MDTLDIQKICSRLNDKAVDIGFFNEPMGVLRTRVDAFVQQSCLEQNLTSHQISPFRWSFNHDGHGIRSGVVEFEQGADSKTMSFTWVDVSDSKITKAPRHAYS